MRNEDKSSRCVQAMPTELGCSPLYNPRAFTPAELKRLAQGQIVNRREVHILTARDGGVEEKIVDFTKTNIPRGEVKRTAMMTGELMETSDGFFFQIPNEE